MFFIFLAIVFLLGALIGPKLPLYRDDEGRERGIPAVLALAFGIIAVLFLAGSFVRVVPANSIGIPVTFGSVGGELSPGLKVVTPFTQIRTFSTRLQELTLGDKDDGEMVDAIEVRGSDGYLMRVGVTIRYKVTAESAVELFRRVGSMDGIRDRIVRPELNEAVRVVFANYTAEDGYSAKRTQVSNDINTAIAKRLAPYGLELDVVLVRNVDPDATLKQAIAERSAARERSLQATLEQERLNTEAETREQVALTDAKALKAKTDGEALAKKTLALAEAQANRDVAASLTPILNDYLRAQALSVANTIYIPMDSTILIGRTE